MGGSAAARSLLGPSPGGRLVRGSVCLPGGTGARAYYSLEEPRFITTYDGSSKDAEKKEDEEESAFEETQEYTEYRKRAIRNNDSYGSSA